TASLDLHDVVLGDNMLFPALPGWDYTTGLGSFDIAAANGALPRPACAPQVPANLTAGPVVDQVLLNWRGAAGATSYAVYQGTSPGGEGATPVATTANTSTVIKNLATGTGATTYYFTVKAVNASGASAASNEAVAVLPATVPSGLVASAMGGGVIKLRWS